MNKDELVQLKERLLVEITPLIIESTGTSSDQFSLLMHVIQSGHATAPVYTRAYESAKSIEEPADRLKALMALLDEIEVDIAQADDKSDEAPVFIESHPAEEQQPQQYSHHDQ